MSKSDTSGTKASKSFYFVNYLKGTFNEKNLWNLSVIFFVIVLKPGVIPESRMRKSGAAFD